MFSLEHPAILSHLGRLAYGFQPVSMAEGHSCLILKMNKESILTVRLRNGFKIYLVPDIATADRSLGFVTAFFDDHDEPLVLFTPLFAGDEMLSDLTAALCQESFDLYFFDEQDRELLGASSQISGVELFRQAIADTQFPMFNANELAGTHAMMKTWFGLRDTDDDARAFTVDLGDHLYPDDYVLIDARDKAYNFHGSDGRIAMTSLEREDPGSWQEHDIVALLLRAFTGETIFLNPMREDSGTELTDVLVVTDEVVLLVQAKDSPNTKATMSRSIDRKQAVIRSHIEKGAKQLRGALSYILEREQIILRTPSGPRAVEVANRAVCGLVVIREMFDSDYEACSAPVLAVANTCKQPCVLLDYSALHLMALHLPSPARFISGLLQLFDFAMEHGEYPKPRFLAMPPNENDAFLFGNATKRK